MAGIIVRIEFKQVSRQLVRKHGDHSIIPVLSAVAMQYRIPPQCIIPQIMISSASETMRDQAPLLCSFPNMTTDTPQVPRDFFIWIISIPTIRPQWLLLPSAAVDFFPKIFFITRIFILYPCWEGSMHHDQNVTHLKLVKNVHNASSTLNRLTKQSACLFPQGMLHHAHLNLGAMICLPSLILDPFLMASFRGLAAHVLWVTPAHYVTCCMHNTMHLLCVTNEVIFLVFVREQFLAPVQEPGQETNGISKEIICIIYIRCIMYIICIICRVQQNKNKIQPTFSQVRSAALYHPHPWQESAGDRGDTTTRTK